MFNKCDAAPDLSWLSAGLHSVKISALTGEGLDRLLNEMVRALPPTRKKVTLLLPYSMGSDAALLREKGALDREEYRPDGLLMTVTADAKLLERLYSKTPTSGIYRGSVLFIVVDRIRRNELYRRSMGSATPQTTLY